MVSLFNSIGFYFLLPLYTSVFLMFLVFHIPFELYYGIMAFCTIITLPIMVQSLFVPLKMQLDISFKEIVTSKKYKLLIVSLCLLILGCSVLDIYVNGFKLLNMQSYAEIYGSGRYIRNITNLCWILIPIAFIFLSSWQFKLFFITFAILFPIIIIDRNRLFISFYVLILCMILTYSSTKINKHLVIRLMLVLLACITIFLTIGIMRSGNSFSVESSYYDLLIGKYPLTSFFMQIPSVFKQIVLYITTPLYNFATIVSYDFWNPDFLLSQLSPFNRESFDLYPFAPVQVARFNVGTEFYPFLLYGGLPMVFCAFMLMLVTFIISAQLLKKFPNIFTLLIFCKISYSMIFIGFAPQFFLLSNLIFLFIMFFLWYISTLIYNIKNKFVESII